MASSMAWLFLLMTSVAAPEVCTNVPGLAWDGNAWRYVFESRSLSESRIASTMLPGLDTAATCFDNQASLFPDAFWLTTPGGIILFLSRSVYAFRPAIFCGVLIVGLPSLSNIRPP